MNDSLFARLSSLVTVADILDPLQVGVLADATLQQAMERIDRLGLNAAQLSLVMHENAVLGWVNPLDIDLALKRRKTKDKSERKHPNSIRDMMQKITPDRLVTSDTPARRAVRLFAKSDPFEPWFVLDGHEIIGSFTYDCFFKPPFKVCLFALALELEQRSLWLCAQDAEASWASLSPKRQKMAIDVKERRDSRRPSSDIDQRMRSGADEMLSHTMFIDKKTMLRKRRLIPEISNRELDEVFNSMENLRNQCAHPDTYEEFFIEPQDLVNQISSCDRVLQAINEHILPLPPTEPPPFPSQPGK